MSATEQDITKHPLYRPHHGDMTGWRVLGPEETILEGDQYAHEYGSWVECVETVGKLVSEGSNAGFYRRRVTPVESKQGEQKRFVTVVYEVKPGCETKFQTEYENDTVIRREIKAGNALATLDAIEDNAVEAVRKAVREGKV